MAENGTFSGKRERAALALAAGRSVRAAARAAGVGERTLHRWRTEAPFVARVQELQMELLRRAVGRLARAMPRAAGKLEALLSSNDERVQLSAAAHLLTNGLRLRDSLELESRLVAVEQQLAGEERS
jgi:hypothetical protein